MDAAQKMELYGNLLYISIAIAAIGLILAVFFFFYFDIRTVRALMTGKAKRQTIERMTEQNNRTGRLQGTSGNVRDASVPVIQPPQGAQEPRYSAVQLHETEDMSYRHTTNTVELPQNDTTVLARNETTVLTRDETTVLNAPEQEETAGGTVVLRRSEAPETVQGPQIPDFRFEVTESTMVIHTGEIIS